MHSDTYQQIVLFIKYNAGMANNGKKQCFLDHRICYLTNNDGSGITSAVTTVLDTSDVGATQWQPARHAQHPHPPQ